MHRLGILRKVLFLPLFLALMAGFGCGDDDPVVINGPAGEFVYIGNGESGDVSVIDAQTCQVVATIDIGGESVDVNSSEDGKHVFVNLRDTDEVVVIETATNTVVKRLSVGATPVHSFLAPDGRHLWIGNDGESSVSVIDVQTLEVVANPAVGDGHRKIAFSEGAPYKAYVSNIADGTVSVVENGTWQDMGTVPVGVAPHGIDFSPTSKMIYNCVRGANSAMVGIDTEGPNADKVGVTVPMTSACGYVIVAPDGRYAWASVGGDDPINVPGKVVVLDTQTDQVIAEIPCGLGPDKISFFPSLGRVAVANGNSPDVTVIDSETYMEVGTLPVGRCHDHRAIRPSLDGKHAYVPNCVDNTVTILDIAAMKVLCTVKVGLHPGGIVVIGDNGRADPYPHR